MRLVAVVLAGLLGLSLLATGAVARATEPPALDLEQAIVLALDANRTLSLQALGPVDARLDVARAEAGFALRLTPVVATDVVDGGDGVTTYGLDASRRFRHGTGVAVRAARSTAVDSLGGRDVWSVEVSQPLLRRFGRLVNEEPLVRADRALDAAERSLARQRADLVVDVVATYHDVLRLGQQVRSDRKAVERVELLARLTEAKERLGRATRIDTLRVSQQLGELEARLQSTRERLELDHEDLAVLVGAEPGTRFELSAAPVLELELPSLEEAVRIALRHRLDYAQALADAADARRHVRIARRELLPDLSASVRYRQLDVSPLPGDDGGAVTMGLRISRDLLGPERRIAVSQARLDEDADHQRVRLVEQLVAQDVQESWLGFRRARAELTILERTLEHAETRLTLAGKLFRMGRADNFTVVDAEEAFVRAESALLAGRAAVAIEGYGLLRSLGTLVEVPPRLRPPAFPAESLS